ncbi:cupin domain-containing protein [Streptomyces sp. NPDC047028]|uniref:JmjC domain-containing protein n=1 Tax=Streptomyces sp. NPDC047028 TaxID=3155793 RepID=UPI0033F7ADB2
MSVHTLSDLVGDTAAFQRTHWRRAPAVFRPATAPRPPMTLADLDAVLSFGALRSSYVELARADKIIPPEAYCGPRTVNQRVHDGFADGGKIRDLVRDGGTLLLRCVDQWHAPTAALTGALAKELGRKVEAFFFVTPPGRQGLRIHRDDADVFVLQLNGSKSWHVHAGPADGDWAPGPIRQDGGPALLTTDLHAGEVLYIPRGYAHHATGSQGLSAHLSLTVREVGGVHLYKALQQALLEGHRITPRPADDAALLDEASIMLTHLKDRLTTLSPHDLLSRARASLLADVTGHTSPGLDDLARSLESAADTAAPDQEKGISSCN